MAVTQLLDNCDCCLMWEERGQSYFKMLLIFFTMNLSPIQMQEVKSPGTLCFVPVPMAHGLQQPFKNLFSLYSFATALQHKDQFCRAISAILRSREVPHSCHCTFLDWEGLEIPPNPILGKNFHPQRSGPTRFSAFLGTQSSFSCKYIFGYVLKPLEHHILLCHTLRTLTL